jgi:hypothetical protein
MKLYAGDVYKVHTVAFSASEVQCGCCLILDVMCKTFGNLPQESNFEHNEKTIADHFSGTRLSIMTPVKFRLILTEIL